MINLARRLLKGALAFRPNRVTAISGQSTGTQTDVSSGCCVDSAGNVVISGYTSPSGAVPGWVAKFNSGYVLQWQRKQSLTARFIVSGFGLDSSDNIYALGSGYVTASPNLPHLFKYNASGTLQWQRKLTSADDSNSLGIVVNSSGDSFICILVLPATAYGLVAKYDTSGALQWQRKLSGAFRVAYSSIAQAHDGGVILAGSMYDGGSAISNSRGIVVKYDASGAIQWQSKIHFTIQGGWSSVAVDSATGDIYVGGDYSVTGVLYGVVAKLNSSGVVQWCIRHPSTSSQIASVIVDPATGNIYFFAQNSGGRLYCVSPSGSLIWERTIIGDASAALTFVAVGGMTISNGDLLIPTFANHSSAGNGFDAVMLRIPLGGGGATTCGYLNIGIPSATTFTSVTPTSVAAGLTDAAGAHTDAAGTATEAAGVMTFTNYTN